MTDYLLPEARAAVPAASVQTKLPRFATGDAKRAVRTFETIVEAGTGHRYVLAQVPSNATITSLRVSSDASITSGAADWGLYTMDRKGNLAAVDQDVFAAARAMAGTTGTFAEILHASGVVDIAALDLPLWRHPKTAGGQPVYSADPGGSFWVVLTVTTTVGGVGTVTAVLDYITAS